MGFITIKKIIAKTGKGAATKQVQAYENIARWVFRGIQLVFALIVVGLYGHRVDGDRKAGNPQSAAWVYATFVASVSSITCVLYAIPFVPVHKAFAWDLTLFILWIAAFGTFANIFLKREGGEEYEGTSVRLMKVAVWIDLVNCLLWLATGAYGSFRTFVGKKIGAAGNRIDGKFEDLENRAKAGFVEKFHTPAPAHMV